MPIGVIVLLMATVLSGCRARSEEVTFRNGDVTLAGTLVLPAGSPPHPAIVFVHGDGPDTREGYRYFARIFAERGIAALIYDKRGAGRSTGQWPTRFADLADDAVAGIQFLRRRDDIDDARTAATRSGWGLEPRRGLSGAPN